MGSFLVHHEREKLGKTLPHRSSSIRITPPRSLIAMHNNCTEVDELLLELADYKNDFADVAAEKLLRKCSTSWEAYQYLQDRAHDAWIPDYARHQLRRIIKRIQVRLHQSREYGWAYEWSEVVGARKSLKCASVIDYCLLSLSFRLIASFSSSSIHWSNPWSI